MAPFLGLLGTVWGVMDAFLNIGLRGTGNLTFVAPGIAEALDVDHRRAGGRDSRGHRLQLVSQSDRRVSDELGHFSSELINVIIRERRA